MTPSNPSIGPRVYLVGQILPALIAAMDKTRKTHKQEVDRAIGLADYAIERMSVTTEGHPNEPAE